MSINIEIVSKGKVITPSGDCMSVSNVFPAWQTPGSVTRNILEQNTLNDKLKAYIKWVLREHLVENEIVNIDVSTPTGEHVHKLVEWVDDQQRLGFTVSLVCS